MAGTFAGQWEAFQGTIENIKIAIGTDLLPVLSQMITSFSQVWATSGPEIMAQFAASAQRFAEWLTPEKLAAIAESLLSIVDGALKLVEAFLSMPPWAQKLLVGGLVANKMSGGGLTGLLGKGAGKLLGVGGAAAGAAGGGGAAAAGGGAAAAGGIGLGAALGVGVGGVAAGALGYNAIAKSQWGQEKGMADLQQFGAVIAHGLGKFFGGQETADQWFSKVAGIQPGGGGTPPQQVDVRVTVDDSGAIQAYVDNQIGSGYDQVTAGWPAPASPGWGW